MKVILIILAISSLKFSNIVVTSEGLEDSNEISGNNQMGSGPSVGSDKDNDPIKAILAGFFGLAKKVTNAAKNIADGGINGLENTAKYGTQLTGKLSEVLQEANTIFQKSPEMIKDIIFPNPSAEAAQKRK
ncbi:uncharacterized protein [Chelonus insularis]|uniref:uncharacterized protein n=1 Tax=Chelonus insularis TaxID=460826 RepID=UPI0015892A9C|nr:uncharacterized protein LOC118064546 [Chelonus insularis]